MLRMLLNKPTRTNQTALLHNPLVYLNTHTLYPAFLAGLISMFNHWPNSQRCRFIYLAQSTATLNMSSSQEIKWSLKFHNRPSFFLFFFRCSFITQNSTPASVREQWVWIDLLRYVHAGNVGSAVTEITKSQAKPTGGMLKKTVASLFQIWIPDQM